MSNPYRIEGPALISFSGGRTSAFMLHEILAAYDGKLPDDVHVAFANTGKEREETLRFVHECGDRWTVPINQLEWRDHVPGFAKVGFNSASRNGEPFDAIINKKKRLPNGQERWCTEYLKVRPIHSFMACWGYGKPGDYAEAIALRYDEGLRIFKGLARSEKDGRRIVYPLSKAKVSKRDVLDFWWGEGRRYETSLQPQGFDLGLPPLWGNCDLCFAMGVAIRQERVRHRPDVADWWSGAEVRTGGTFSKRESVADIQRNARKKAETVELFDDDEADAECGLTCEA